MSNTEITVTDKSATLATAGKYCDKNIFVNAAPVFEKGKSECKNFTVVTGTFTPAEDTSTLNLEIPPGAKLFEIVPMTVPTDELMVLYGSASALISERSARKNGALVEYCATVSGIRKYASSLYPVSFENGISFTMTAGICFAANCQYIWTAYYWDEEV